MDKIRNTALLLNIAKMSTSNVIMYMLPIVVTPILSRLFTPAEFGDWGIFSSVISILSVCCFLGFENAIVKTNDSDIKDMSTICVLSSVLVNGLIILAFIIGRNFQIDFFVKFSSIGLLAIYMLFYTIFTIYYNIQNKYSQYTTLAFNSVVQGGTQAVTRIVLGIVRFPFANGLILGTTIAQGISALYLSVTAKDTNAKLGVVRKVSFKNMRNLVVANKRFPIYDAPSSLLSFSAFNLPVIILSLYFGKASIGCYSILLQILLLPMSFVGSAIGRVYYQELCDNGNDKKKQQQCTYKVVKMVSMISIIPMLLLVCGCDKLIVIFLGSNWNNAGNIALAMSLWSFATIQVQPLLPIFRYLNKQNMLLVFDLLYFVFGIGSILVGCQQAESILSVLLVFSIVTLIVKSAEFLLILRYSGVKMDVISRFLPLWSLAILILIIRILWI